jgi:hypothetical protein
LLPSAFITQVSSWMTSPMLARFRITAGGAIESAAIGVSPMRRFLVFGLGDRLAVTGR